MTSKAEPIEVVERKDTFYVHEIAVKVKVEKSYTYTLQLGSTVEHSAAYSGLIAFLQNTTERDVIKLILASFGGCCHGCITLVNALKACKARVEVIVTSPCYSAGSTLALCGDSLTMNPNTFLMFHNYSSVSHGKGQELIDKTANTDKWISTYFSDLHCPFVTKREGAAIIADKDLYVHWDDKDLAKRIKRHFK